MRSLSIILLLALAGCASSGGMDRVNTGGGDISNSCVTIINYGNATTQTVSPTTTLPVGPGAGGLPLLAAQAASPPAASNFGNCIVDGTTTITKTVVTPPVTKN